MSIIATLPKNNNQKVVFVVYYSLYGHVRTLAHQICKGLERAGETLSDEILEKMKAPPKDPNVPHIIAAQLAEAHGIMFGFPARYGMLPSQVKTFFDSCGQVYLAKGLTNKFVGTFFSTSGIGTGQETLVLSCMPFFAHMGMIFVFIGGKHKNIGDLSMIHGGSPWGSGTVSAKDNSRIVNELELELAEFQGYDFGSLVKRMTY